MIFKGSRYQNSSTYQVTLADGSTATALTMRLVPPTPAGFRYTVAGHDRLDLLAYRFYNNPEKFWLIADANTEMDAEDLLETGRQILIPPDVS
jgi:hypothetical protein